MCFFSFFSDTPAPITAITTAPLAGKTIPARMLLKQFPVFRDVDLPLVVGKFFKRHVHSLFYRPLVYILRLCQVMIKGTSVVLHDSNSEDNKEKQRFAASWFAPGEKFTRKAIFSKWIFCMYIFSSRVYFSLFNEAFVIEDLG